MGPLFRIIGRLEAQNMPVVICSRGAMRESNLHRRLRRLENQARADDDGSGLPRHSTEWLSFWIDWGRRRLAAEDPQPARIPLEAFRAIVALADSET